MTDENRPDGQSAESTSDASAEQVEDTAEDTDELAADSGAGDALPPHLADLVAAIQASFPNLEPTTKDDGWIDLFVPADDLKSVALTLRDNDDLNFDYLSMISAVDYEDDGFQVVYHLLSLEANKKLAVKINLPDRDNPVVPSVTDVWPTADFHEREAYDMMGIRFDGHPNLRRILMREDWVGHPLRKDYVDARPPRERVTKESYYENLKKGREQDGPV